MVTAEIRTRARVEAINVVRRALAVAELHAPAAARGAFIPAGNLFDALSAMTRVRLREHPNIRAVCDDTPIM